MESEYLFTSERIGFREWKLTDLSQMAAINADPRVMEFFPSLQSVDQTADFISRNQQLFAETGFCYFAVELLAPKEFIGFIGFSRVTFEADFTPCIDIGWRLAFQYWNNGYATEGAKRCIRFAFEKLHLSKLYSIAPKINVNSISVMQKIGMNPVTDFKHPMLTDFPTLEICMLYSIDK